jgi:hypothetical protein
MITPIDTKSVFLGLLLGVIVMTGIAATTQLKQIPGPVGRFQIETSEKGMCVIDTVTGQVWARSVIESSNRDTFYNPKISVND